MSIPYNHATIYTQILRARGKMMRLLGLFQQADSLPEFLIVAGLLCGYMGMRQGIRSLSLGPPEEFLPPYAQVMRSLVVCKSSSISKGFCKPMIPRCSISRPGLWSLPDGPE